MGIPSKSKAAKAGKYAGWTVPSNYQPIHETLRMLKVVPYENYGEITLRAVITKYWKEVLLAHVLIICLCLATVYFRRLNLRLSIAQEQIQEELLERKRAQEKLKIASEEVHEKNLALEKNLDQIKQMQDSARIEIEREKEGALSELRSEVARLAIDAAEKLLSENLDAEKNRKLVKDFLDDVSSN